MSNIFIKAAKNAKNAQIYAIFLIAFFIFSLVLAKSVEAATLTLEPNEAGMMNYMFTANPSANTHWFNVLSSDGDTTYVYSSNATYQTESYGLQDVSGITGEISDVTVYIEVAASSVTQASAKTVLLVGGTFYTGTAYRIPITTDYIVTSTKYSLNPKTAAAWSWDDLGALQAGASLRTPAGGVSRTRCTHVWAVVTYNNAPVATDDEITTDEDNPVIANVLGNDTDIDGDTLSVNAITSAPLNGTVEIQPDNTILYTPNDNYNGSDSFTYSVSDGNGGASATTAHITVNSVDDAPIANADAYSTDEEIMITVNSAEGVLANDTDIDTDVSLLTAELVSGVTNGTLNFNADGSFDYAPNENFSGTDSFTYRTFDGEVYGDSVAVTININKVNDSPVANADSYSFSEDKTLDVAAETGVLANDTDADGDTLGAILVDDVSHGILTFNADGSFNYVPDENYNGTDSFTYVANDGEYDSGEAVVAIAVNATNDSPEGTDGAIMVDEDNPYVFTINDFGFKDVDTGDTLSKIRIESLPTIGRMTLGGSNFEAGTEISAEAISDGRLVYASADNEYGESYSSFTFSVFDSNIEDPSYISLSPNTIIFNVAPTNDAPMAVDDESYTADQNSNLTIGYNDGVLANDSDIDGDILVALIDLEPSHGTITLNEDGGFDYAPETDYIGSDSFTYVAYDGVSYSEPAAVYINVADAAPYVTRAEAISSTEVKIFFNELLRDDDLYRPLASDFKIYHSEEAAEIPIASISYETKIVTVYLGEDIVVGDAPTYEVLPDSGDIRDHSDNVLSAILSGNVIDRIAPSFVVSADTISAEVGNNINFSIAEADDVWSGIKQYVWSFGDDTVYTTTLPNMSHSYSTDGTYNATVTVYDNNDNAASTSISIAITDNSSSIGTASGGGGGDSSGGSSSGVSSSTTTIGSGVTSTTISAGIATATSSIGGQVLGEKISRLDELVKLTKYGERSENVRELQLELKNAGFFPKWHVVTGYFGPITLNSVKKYLASQNRLAELRNVKIDELIALTKYGERSDNVKSLQTELKNAVFFPKYQTSTGYFGPITLASVKRYQAYITL